MSLSCAFEGGLRLDFTSCEAYFIKKKIFIQRTGGMPKSAERRAAMRDELGARVVPLPADLAHPSMAYLVNNAWTAKMGAWDDFSVGAIERTIALSCSALGALCPPSC